MDRGLNAAAVGRAHQRPAPDPAAPDGARISEPERAPVAAAPRGPNAERQADLHRAIADLHRALRAARGEILRCIRRRRAVIACGLGTLVLITAAVSDAFLWLPAVTRTFARSLGFGLALVGVLLLIVGASRRRLPASDLDLANEIDRVLNEPGRLVRTAVELADQARQSLLAQQRQRALNRSQVAPQAPDHGPSPGTFGVDEVALTVRAIGQGVIAIERAIAGGGSPLKQLPRGRRGDLSRAAARVLSYVVLVLLSLVAATALVDPRMVAVPAARLLAPAGDIPPWSPLVLEVRATLPENSLPAAFTRIPRTPPTDPDATGEVVHRSADVAALIEPVLTRRDSIRIEVTVTGPRRELERVGGIGIMELDDSGGAMQPGLRDLLSTNERVPDALWSHSAPSAVHPTREPLAEPEEGDDPGLPHLGAGPSDQRRFVGVLPALFSPPAGSDFEGDWAADSDRKTYTLRRPLRGVHRLIAVALPGPTSPARSGTDAEDTGRGFPTASPPGGAATLSGSRSRRALGRSRILEHDVPAAPELQSVFMQVASVDAGPPQASDSLLPFGVNPAVNPYHPQWRVPLSMFLPGTADPADPNRGPGGRMSGFHPAVWSEATTTWEHSGRPSPDAVASGAWAVGRALLFDAYTGEAKTVAEVFVEQWTPAGFVDLVDVADPHALHVRSAAAVPHSARSVRSSWAIELTEDGGSLATVLCRVSVRAKSPKHGLVSTTVAQIGFAAIPPSGPAAGAADEIAASEGALLVLFPADVDAVISFLEDGQLPADRAISGGGGLTLRTLALATANAAATAGAGADASGSAGGPTAGESSAATSATEPAAGWRTDGFGRGSNDNATTTPAAAAAGEGEGTGEGDGEVGKRSLARDEAAGGNHVPGSSASGADTDGPTSEPPDDPGGQDDGRGADPLPEGIALSAGRRANLVPREGATGNADGERASAQADVLNTFVDSPERALRQEVAQRWAVATPLEQALALAWLDHLLGADPSPPAPDAR